MKIFSPSEEMSNFSRLAIPTGRVMPRAPVPGELFNLEVDTPETHTVNPWFSRGTYVFDGLKWRKLNDGARQRRAEPVGSRQVEVEIVSDPQEIPNPRAGSRFASLVITPSHGKASISGSIAVCLDTDVARTVWLAIFRAERLVGASAAFVVPGQITNLTATFIDIPLATEPVTYTVQICSDAVGVIYVNQGRKMTFDGALQTAFIAAENC